MRLFSAPHVVFPAINDCREEWRKFVASSVASLSQVSEVARCPVDDAVRRALGLQKALFEEACQVALQGAPVDARTHGLEILNLERALRQRQFQRHTLTRRELVFFRQNVQPY